MKRSATILISVASGVVLLAAGATAGAAVAGPVDSSGVIHACYANTTTNGQHAVLLQNVGTSCPSGMTAITWNQQGPTGPAGPAGPAGPVGPAGAIGPQGPKGDTGAQGPVGPAGPIGATGPAGPAGADGHTVLNGTTAPADSLGTDGDFYLNTTTDVLYGPKANGTWPANGTSLVGPAGPAGTTGAAGPPGPQGAPGPAGTSGLSAVTDLNGLTCTTNGGADGTITVQPASSDNTIALKCDASPTDASCTHSNGAGGTYTDCNDALGDPSTGSGYNLTMATDAAHSAKTVNPDTFEFLGSVTTHCFLTGSATVEIVGGSPTAQQVLIWQYSGPNTGHVHAQTIDSTQQVTFECPTSSDPAWN